MDVFEVHEQLISDYRAFTSGFVEIADRRIAAHVRERLESKSQWPDPWLSLNPNFEPGGTIIELTDVEQVLHPECRKIFRIKQTPDDFGRELRLHRHQREAIEAAGTKGSYVLTTGTGSGKSLSYMIPIVDRVLKLRDEAKAGRSVKAIIVYPMNALANSQLHELQKFLQYGYPQRGEPVTFARYTGQERDETRRQILAEPPDILLTNYVMLELLLTRPDERKHLIRAASGLEFLVLDELHTYRGRAGADVAMLVRRVRDACESPDLQCVGTSATMASGGTWEDQRRVVADVATRLFGSEVSPERVIGETLERATSGSAAPDDLKRCIPIELHEWTYEEFVADPLATWVEDTFGMTLDDATGRLVRSRPTTLPAAAATLARLTGETEDACAEAIRATLRVGARVMHPKTGRPVFAFRLHQFLSKGDNVHVSFEPEDVRHITSRYQTAVPQDPGKPLIPLAFCRECGQEYLVVSRLRDGSGTRYIARRDNDASGDADAGYLYLSSVHPWSPTTEIAVTDGRLPESWLTVLVDGTTHVVDARKKYLPEVVRVTSSGHQVRDESGVQAAYVPSPFLFCLRCRVSYEQVRGSDFAKLGSLSAEGRSSATSIISSSVVGTLRSSAEQDLPEDARKLLVFVDNRQDASLQAGHFNDFVQVAMLRGALYRAASAVPDGLTHELVAERVTEALGLSTPEFAANPDAKFSAEREARRALRGVIELRLYQDLERGWRITMPNLEQSGLLEVDYRDLHDLSADEESWADCHTALRDDRPGHRYEIAKILLDELRRGLAIQVECLGEDGFDRLRRLARQELREPWSIPDRERWQSPGVAVPGASRPGRARREIYFSSRGVFGRYLRQATVFPHATGLKAEDTQHIIDDLFRVLERTGLLTKAQSDGDKSPGYRLKASTILWKPGDGTAGMEDPLRRRVDDERGPRVNPFFRDLYRETAHKLRGLHAREHTAQVHPEDRLEREEAFRKATLPILYCSPTMELGVDIASLNAVGLRNVPPTPANYAQRSGRAGRSGQAALVVTYCATGNAHDQYYFRRSDQMVAGSVAPPRLDLTNEDLLRSHVNAVWLAETGQHLHGSLAAILDAGGENPLLVLLPAVEKALTGAGAKQRAAERAHRVLNRLKPALREASWWGEDWVEQVVESAPDNLNAACDRWRDLYRGALGEFKEQNRVMLDQSATKRQRDQARGRRYEAENRMRLLRNEDSDQGATDFYSYRYLASEGFLPGYSFPRLPLAAYVPGQRGFAREGDYIQRARFLAIREFGPGALIYHEGARYQVDKVQLPPTQPGQQTLDTQEARRCEDCGYLHERQVGVDVCESCGGSLGAALTGLLRLQTVYTVRRERISSDEEERRRQGFELETSYRFHDHGSRPGRIEATAAKDDGQPLVDLVYGDTATVRITNLGRRRRKIKEDRGFWLDVQTGRWLSERAASAEPTSDAEELDAAEDVKTKAKVLPYVEDRRNILVTRLPRRVDEETAVSFMYALERGIEAAFQLEDSELTSEQLPDLGNRGRVLFVESAEGGAGVLRRLVDEPDALARAAREALAIAHFDSETGKDTGGKDESGERCEKACYDCLLSYSNQLVHHLIDRHTVGDLLLALANGSTTRGAGGVDRGDQQVKLTAKVESGLEQQVVDWLAARGYRLPDDAQVLIEEAGARPDFVYYGKGSATAIFIDGPQHDEERAQVRDKRAAFALEDLGWQVIRIRYDDDLQSIVSRYGSVFGRGGAA